MRGYAGLCGFMRADGVREQRIGRYRSICHGGRTASGGRRVGGREVGRLGGREVGQDGEWAVGRTGGREVGRSGVGIEVGREKKVDLGF